MKKLCFILVVGLLVYSGCGLFGGKSYYPLAVGNVWKYEIKSIRVDSARTDSTISQTTTTVTGTDVLADEREVFVVVATVTGGSSTSYMLEEGDYLLSFSSKTDSMPDTMLVTPLETGKSWTVTSFPIIGALTASVTGEEDVTVKAGEYTGCAVVKYSYGNNPNLVDNKTWYAKGVGGAKTYVENKIPMPNYTITTKVTTELTEFTEK